MQTTLIIIRGNSGSGKTTLAQALQAQLGHHTLLVSQDVVRRDMLMSRDYPGNLAIDLIQKIAQYGLAKVPVVIVEGILARERYGAMLAQLSQAFPQVLTYYFDVSFETTLIRHQSRQCDFGPAEMRQWWLPDDQFGVSNERIFTAEQDLAAEVQQVLSDLHHVGGMISD
ncbi:kinase [Lactiplantibacillus pentosus]|uniref:Kinase n=3 Tax=Lactiplantibacillus pentosus TaxID=1589 RepID=A0AAX6LCP3_LACPE|nr:kinase [Lactiplantibacillus pentosus]AYJ41224.1 hypothetical protein LP314_04545 [Lactiplantibacillus pentosus]KRK27097.1 hypothetical protein FD24_GL000245 [Lactiplantibacillus pentosus DSM 20314]MBU7496158.1 kinase [Lactiplantibacillus pentosus]MCC3161390.1 kinase [Lactiplantibacillus pentosus]MCJ8187004.1 kinase [Lactiplantibacillus pentosus]